MTRILLLALAAAAQAVPAFTVAYHSNDHAAPLYDACLYPKDFRARYGLYLKEVKLRELYELFDGPQNTLSLRIASFDSDSAALSCLLAGRADLGILGAERVLDAVLDAQPVRILAPLQHGGDMLVVNRSAPAADWTEFIAWAKTQSQPVAIGHLGAQTMTVLGFEQALEYENVKVNMVRVQDWPALAVELKSGQLDAAVLQEPAATLVSAAGAGRTIGRIDILPPGRFEDRPGTIIAATDSAIRTRGADISRFLELMAVATHYANNRTHNTLAAATRWLGTPPAVESVALRNIAFSSLPDYVFGDGIWNWYFALRLKKAVPDSLSGLMEKKDWLGIPYDSLLLMPALDRAGARIIR